MRSIEDILLQLILHGDSFTYHSVAFRPFATPYRVGPLCCIMHNHVVHDLIHHAAHTSCCPCIMLPMISSIMLPVHHAATQFYYQMYISLSCFLWLAA